jgi:hypothetical protein
MSSGLSPDTQSTQLDFQPKPDCLNQNNTDIKQLQPPSIVDYKYNPDDMYQDNHTCVEGTRGCIIACTKSTGIFDQACFQQCMKTSFIC